MKFYLKQSTKCCLKFHPMKYSKKINCDKILSLDVYNKMGINKMIYAQAWVLKYHIFQKIKHHKNTNNPNTINVYYALIQQGAVTPVTAALQT